MDEVKTGVDDLMELLRQEQRITLAEAAKRLKQTEKIVQNWVDFLVEERLLGIEYKFTTPYIYLNAPEKAQSILQKPETVESIRKTFAAHAKEKGMPDDKIPALWQNHLLSVIESKHEYFAQECTKRNIASSPAAIDELFKRYKEKALKTYELGTSY